MLNSSIPGSPNKKECDSPVKHEHGLEVRHSSI